jgi:HTH-type transcriptional regulator/antitoxin HigA
MKTRNPGGMVTRNTIKPIRSEVDYDEALATINELWDAEPGTAAADRLEVLVTLVEAYEEKAWPIDPPDPLAAIRFRMEQQVPTPKNPCPPRKKK